MADGGSYQAIGAALGAPRLNQALAARSSLWAVCTCGREAALDASHWLGQGLGRHCIEDLEDRVRCECGARRAKLEIRGLAEAPQRPMGGVYVFR